MATKKEVAWESLNEQIVDCVRCTRLRIHCKTIAKEKRRSFIKDDYWGLPVPNLGDPKSKLLIVGLAPAAHGANRTGRMFTGDRSGDWLFRALHRAGFANQAEATSADDGLKLRGCAITAICHCAPPDNKPTADEIANCRPWLDRLLDANDYRVFLALGQIGWRGIWKSLRDREMCSGAIPKFGHGAEVPVGKNCRLIGSYHPSQQNTFTGKLTEQMFDDVFQRVNAILADTL